MDYIQKNLLIKSAEKMTEREQYILGHQYLRGDGVERDEDLGIRLLMLAYKKDKKQLCTLANALCIGDGFTKDVKRGISILTDLSNQGCADADYLLGNMYNGLIKEIVDPKKAFYHYERAAKKNHVSAIHNVGTSYQNGSGVEKDYAKALEYYNKSKKMGCAQSCINLGSMYELGLGVKQDYDQALKLYIEGCKSGDPIAYYNIGNMYYQGMGRPKDFKKAYQYLIKGAKAGCPDCKFVLGLMYQNGEGVDIDYDKARIYYEEAIKGNIVVANNNLATLYKNGLGVEKSDDKAYQLIKTAADQGCSIGKLNVAMSYMAGLGVEKDLDQAKAILEGFTDNPSLGIATNYLLGKLYQQYNEFAIKEISNYKKIIDSFLKSYSFYTNNTEEDNVLGVGDRINITYACFDCIELAGTYLELCYIDEANTDDRSAVHYQKDNRYKVLAKQYLDIALELQDGVLDDVSEELGSAINTFRGFLDDTSDNISKLDYASFKEKYFDKYPMIFLITQKKEYEIYEHGIRLYFEKRDNLVSELNNRKTISQQEFEKTEPLIRKMLAKKGLSAEQIDQKLEEARPSQDKGSSNFDLDYSNSVSNIDKYLEEILHAIFVDGFYEYSREKCINKVNDLIDKISGSVADIDEKVLLKLSSLLNNIGENITLDRSVRENNIKKFLGFFRDGKWKKGLNQDKVDLIKDYMLDNAIDLEEVEIDLMNNIVAINDTIHEFGDITKDEKFELGRLYHLAYIDSDSLLVGPVHKALNEKFVQFVKDINPSIEEHELRLKLNELILKVEMFRVVVRNVASHKSKLKQLAVEDGINICIAQENSIFQLINELFGDYISNQYAKNFINGMDI